MKKLATLVVLLAGIYNSLADAPINFNNNSVFGTPNPADRLVTDIDKVTPLTGTNYVAQLYFAKGGGVLPSSLASSGGALAKFRVGTTTSPGTWSGGTRTLAGVNVGDTITLQVRVWDGAKFASFADATAGGGITGSSDAFNHLLIASTPAAPTDTLMVNFRGFSLVPEPSTIALGILGGVALLVARRRK